MSTKRALHFVFRIGSRKATINFYRDVLGMKVLRHEEFDQGCTATCNGPYDTKWSKTMIGYGDEDNNFVVELTYNYGIKKYELGNDFLGLTINSTEVIPNASRHSYPYEKIDEDHALLLAPDGYKFCVDEKNPQTDSVTLVSLACSDLKKSIEYWHGLLKMNVYEEKEKSAILGFADDQCKLQLIELSVPIDRAEAFGRIAFSCPSEELKPLEQLMKEHQQTILTPYISLDTPGKATVQVVILADPDGHEICFVGDEGFRELSKVDPQGESLLDKAMDEDKSDEWFANKK